MECEEWKGESVKVKEKGIKEDEPVHLSINPSLDFAELLNDLSPSYQKPRRQIQVTNIPVNLPTNIPINQ